MSKVLFVMIVVPAILYFIYNIVCYKNKKVVYTIDYKTRRFIVLNDKYYKTQLIFSTVNCALLIIEGILFTYGSFKQNHVTFTIIYPLTFWTINYLLKLISFKKNYAQLID